jgi:integrase
MNVREHDDPDRGMKVWLSDDEIAQLLEAAPGPNQRLAFALAGRCGLRSEEITEVRPKDVKDSDAGPILVVRSGKGEKYRETPIPKDLKNTIETAAQYRSEPATHPIVTTDRDAGGDGVSTRTLRRWIKQTRDELADEGDERWRHVSMHDLRRSWATNLKASEVDALLVLDWGGWEDLETFLNHYRGTYAPEAQRREREKVEWL